MALTKIGSGGIENVTNAANATFLTIDASEQITVVSENGAVTTSLQQGILKCWVYGAADGSTAYDSFNLSSLGDTGAGHQTVNFTNNFNNNNYVVTASQGTGNQHHVKIDSRATSS